MAAASEGSENGTAGNTGDITGQVIPPAKPRRPGSENLVPPWPKGRSGNPKGRPKRPLTDALSLISNKKTPDEILQKMPASMRMVVGKRPTLAQVLMYRLVATAIAGDVSALKLIFDRLEGRLPKDSSGVSDPGQLDQLIAVLEAGYVEPGEVNPDVEEEAV